MKKFIASIKLVAGLAVFLYAFSCLLSGYVFALGRHSSIIEREASPFFFYVFVMLYIVFSISLVIKGRKGFSEGENDLP